ncbi:GNAT family N-acetyltransferase [Ferrovibrio sp. MS7]|uniref:GNAT family N-acetyltransferase n=1 Tax=Ferrovibrio plantarum TaxID=3119164 RepID=UPI00313486C8
MAAIRVERLHGEQLLTRLDDLARLRITVFRDWPYLYEGDISYERQYLERYARAKTGTIVVALDGEQAVGAATALALEEEVDYVQAPFLAAGMDVKPIFYFGESVLLKQYRGHGIGVGFFNEREAAARRFAKRICCFCGVQRPADHPMKPADYVPLDAFWTKRGYSKRPDLVSSFSWTDIGDTAQTAKPMVYWMRELPA